MRNVDAVCLRRPLFGQQECADKVHGDSKPLNQSTHGFNNGPPPTCKIADCLNCDETMSGPGFQTVAARSRRRSCDNLLIVNHEPPCKGSQVKSNARGLQGEQSSERPQQPLRYVPPNPTETCFYIETSLGLGGYAEITGNTLLSLIFSGD